MKKIITLFAFIIVTSLSAQNLQLHYDFDREHFTTTFELFKVDKLGNTYMFVDFDFDGEDGISQAYLEVARVIQTKKMPIGLHLEFNGGLGNFSSDEEGGLDGYTLNNAFLIGANYGKGNAVWGFSSYVAYKAFQNAGKANYQVTGVWYWNLIKDKLTFSGFADVWSEYGLSDKTIFLSEPQLWYHLNKSFSLGGEIELSNNFAGVNSFQAHPTVAVKWNI